MFEPEWTAKNIIRKKGDTTLQTCGWCKYSTGNYYKHQCLLEGKCGILEVYSRRVFYDTECKIIKLGKQNIERLIDKRKVKIAQHQEEIKEIREEICNLKNLNLLVEDVPPLAYNRRHNHFKIGNEVMIFISAEERWISGKVIKGDRHQNETITIQLDEKVKIKEGFYVEKITGITANSACILRTEYDWFMENEDYLALWLEMSGKKIKNTAILNLKNNKDK